MNLSPESQKIEIFYRQISSNFEKLSGNEFSRNINNCNMGRNDLSGGTRLLDDTQRVEKDFAYLEKQLNIDRSPSVTSARLDSDHSNQNSIGQLKVTKKIRFEGDNESHDASLNKCDSHSSLSSLESNDSKDTHSLRSIYKLITNYQTCQHQHKNYSPKSISRDFKERSENFINKHNIKPITVETLSSESSKSLTTVIQCSKSSDIDEPKKEIVLDDFSHNINNGNISIESANSSFLKPKSERFNETCNPGKGGNFKSVVFGESFLKNKTLSEIDLLENKYKKFDLKIKNGVGEKIVKSKLLGDDKHNGLISSKRNNNVDKRVFRKNQIDVMLENRKVLNQKLQKVKEWLMSLESYRARGDSLTKTNSELSRSDFSVPNKKVDNHKNIQFAYNTLYGKRQIK